FLPVAPGLRVAGARAAPHHDGSPKHNLALLPLRGTAHRRARGARRRGGHFGVDGPRGPGAAQVGRWRRPRARVASRLKSAGLGHSWLNSFSLKPDPLAPAGTPAEGGAGRLRDLLSSSAPAALHRVLLVSQGQGPPA